MHCLLIITWSYLITTSWCLTVIFQSEGLQDSYNLHGRNEIKQDTTLLTLRKGLCQGLFLSNWMDCVQQQWIQIFSPVNSAEIPDTFDHEKLVDLEQDYDAQTNTIILIIRLKVHPSIPSTGSATKSGNAFEVPASLDIKIVFDDPITMDGEELKHEFSLTIHPTDFECYRMQGRWVTNIGLMIRDKIHEKFDLKNYPLRRNLYFISEGQPRQVVQYNLMDVEIPKYKTIGQTTNLHIIPRVQYQQEIQSRDAQDPSTKYLLDDDVIAFTLHLGAKYLNNGEQAVHSMDIPVGNVWIEIPRDFTLKKVNVPQEQKGK